MKQYYFIVWIMFSSFYMWASNYPISLSEKLDNSDMIVEGKVVSSLSYEEEGLIWSKYEVEIYRNFTGQKDKIVEVHHIGGKFGEKELLNSASPDLQVGQRGIFFLQEFESKYLLFAARQGFYEYDPYKKVATTLFEGELDNGKLIAQIVNQTHYSIIIRQDYELLMDWGNYIKGLSLLKNNFDSLENSVNVPIKGSKTRVKAKAKGPLVCDLGPDHIEDTEGQNAITILSFTPTSLSSGRNLNGSLLTINGVGFGATRGAGFIQFRFTDNGGSGWMSPVAGEYLSWSNTQIQVYVPAKAGSGFFRVVNNSAEVAESPTPIGIGSAVLNNAVFSVPTYAKVTNQDGFGGLTFTLNSSFASNSDRRASFFRAYRTVLCNSTISWRIAFPTTAISTAAQDGVNAVFMTNNPAITPPGVLGVAYRYVQSCGGNTAFLVEEDIAFPTTISFHYLSSACPSSDYDFESVALHELLHAHQIDHVNNPSDPMWYTFTSGEMRRFLSPGNQNGINFINGQSTISPLCGAPAMLPRQSCSNPTDAADFTLNDGSTSNFCPGEIIKVRLDNINMTDAYSIVVQKNILNPSDVVVNQAPQTSANNVYEIPVFYTNPGLYVMAVQVYTHSGIISSSPKAITISGSGGSSGTILGSLSASCGSNLVYQIQNPVAGATYNWTVPSGATINSGQGTSSINVTFGSVSGNVSAFRTGPGSGCYSPANLFVNAGTNFAGDLPCTAISLGTPVKSAGICIPACLNMFNSTGSSYQTNNIVGNALYSAGAVCDPDVPSPIGIHSDVWFKLKVPPSGYYSGNTFFDGSNRGLVQTYFVNKNTTIDTLCPDLELTPITTPCPGWNTFGSDIAPGFPGSVQTARFNNTVWMQPGTDVFVRIYGRNGLTASNPFEFGLCMNDPFLAPAFDEPCGAINITPTTSAWPASCTAPNNNYLSLQALNPGANDMFGASYNNDPNFGGEMSCGTPPLPIKWAWDTWLKVVVPPSHVGNGMTVKINFDASYDAVTNPVWHAMEVFRVASGGCVAGNLNLQKITCKSVSHTNELSVFSPIEAGETYYVRVASTDAPPVGWGACVEDLPIGDNDILCGAIDVTPSVWEYGGNCRTEPMNDLSLFPYSVVGMTWSNAAHQGGSAFVAPWNTNEYRTSRGIIDNMTPPDLGDGQAQFDAWFKFVAPTERVSVTVGQYNVAGGLERGGGRIVIYELASGSCASSSSTSGYTLTRLSTSTFNEFNSANYSRATETNPSLYHTTRHMATGLIPGKEYYIRYIRFAVNSAPNDKIGVCLRAQFPTPPAYDEPTGAIQLNLAQTEFTCLPTDVYNLRHGRYQSNIANGGDVYSSSFELHFSKGNSTSYGSEMDRFGGGTNYSYTSQPIAFGIGPDYWFKFDGPQSGSVVLNIQNLAGWGGLAYDGIPKNSGEIDVMDDYAPYFVPILYYDDDNDPSNGMTFVGNGQVALPDMRLESADFITARESYFDDLVPGGAYYIRMVSMAEHLDMIFSMCIREVTSPQNCINAQNHIPNGSFEDFYSSPTGASIAGCQTDVLDFNSGVIGPRIVDGLKAVDFCYSNWKRTSAGTVDPYHQLANVNVTQSQRTTVPTSGFGTLNAQQGSGYLGLITLYRSGSSPVTLPTQDREYAYTRLTRPLVCGRTYRYQFYVAGMNAMALNTSRVSLVFLNSEPYKFPHRKAHSGPFLSTDPIVETIITSSATNTFPAQTNGVIGGNVDGQVDYINGWIRVEGTFVATGLERYVMLGNLEDLTTFQHSTDVRGTGGCAHSSTCVAVDRSYAYYVYDNISLVEENNPDLSEITNFTVTNPGCGLSNGQVSIPGTSIATCAGDVTPHYVWTGLPPTAVITNNGTTVTNLSGGVYTVTETTPFGCSRQGTVIVNTSTPPASSATINQAPDCSPAANGVVTINFGFTASSTTLAFVEMNGNPVPGSPFASGTSTQVTGLSEGAYNFTVRRSSNNCITNLIVDLPSPSPLPFEITDVSSVFSQAACDDTSISTGQITVKVKELVTTSGCGTATSSCVTPPNDFKYFKPTAYHLRTTICPNPAPNHCFDGRLIGSPFNGTTRNRRTQYIYTPAQLGVTEPGNVTRLGFLILNVNSSAGYTPPSTQKNVSFEPIRNFYLKIACTNESDLSSGFLPTTTMIGPVDLNLVGVSGWYYFDLPGDGFYWDGQTNLVIETHYANTINDAGGIAYAEHPTPSTATVRDAWNNTLFTDASIMTTNNTLYNDALPQLDLYMCKPEQGIVPKVYSIVGPTSFTYPQDNAVEKTFLGLTSGGLYTIRVTDPTTGCYEERVIAPNCTVPVIVPDPDTTPKVTAYLTATNPSICGGGSTDLVLFFDVAPASYTWFDANTTNQVRTFSPAVTTTYTVNLDYSNHPGINDTTLSITILVDEGPTCYLGDASVVITADDGRCGAARDTIILTFDVDTIPQSVVVLPLASAEPVIITGNVWKIPVFPTATTLYTVNMNFSNIPVIGKTISKTITIDRVANTLTTISAGTDKYIACPGTSTQLEGDIFPLISYKGSTESCGGLNISCNGNAGTPTVGIFETGTNNTEEGPFKKSKDSWRYFIPLQDLQAAGLNPGNITSLALKYRSGGATYPNFEIKMKCLSMTDWTGNFATCTQCQNELNWQTVRNPANLVTTGYSNNDWITIPFDKDFNWDGTTGILVYTCKTGNDASTKLYVQGSTGTNWGRRYTSCGNTGAGDLANKYNLRFSMCYETGVGTSFAWTPSTGLSSTTVLNPNVSGIVTPTTYTLTATRLGCSVSDQVTVYPCAATGATLATSPATICPGDNSQLVLAMNPSQLPQNITWLNTTGFVGSPAGNMVGDTVRVTVAPLASQTYSVELDFRNIPTINQIVVITTTLTVNTPSSCYPPVVPVSIITPSPNPICEGQQTTLNVSFDPTYPPQSWKWLTTTAMVDSNVLNATIQSGTTLGTLPAGVYTYTIEADYTNYPEIGSVLTHSANVTVTPFTFNAFDAGPNKVSTCAGGVLLDAVATIPGSVAVYPGGVCGNSSYTNGLTAGDINVYQATGNNTSNLDIDTTANYVTKTSGTANFENRGPFINKSSDANPNYALTILKEAQLTGLLGYNIRGMYIKGQRPYTSGVFPLLLNYTLPNLQIWMKCKDPASFTWWTDIGSGVDNPTHLDYRNNVGFTKVLNGSDQIIVTEQSNVASNLAWDYVEFDQPFYYKGGDIILKTMMDDMGSYLPLKGDRSGSPGTQTCPTCYYIGLARYFSGWIAGLSPFRPDIRLVGNEAVLAGGGNATVVWTPSAGLSDPNIVQPVASPLVPTMYKMTSTNGACTIEDSVFVDVKPQITNVVANISCPGLDGNSVITLEPVGGSGYFDYNVNGGGFSSTFDGNVPHHVIVPNSAGHNVVVRDNLNCNFTVNLTAEATPTIINPITQSGTCYLGGSNKWVYVLDASGRALCAINDNGYNMGNVSVTSYVAGSPHIVSDVAYLQRSFVIQPEFSPAGNVRIRFFMEQSEVDDLIDAFQNTTVQTDDDLYTFDSLLVVKYSGPSEDGTISFAAGSVVNIQRSGAGTALGGRRYIDIQTHTFSEFWITGGGLPTVPLFVELLSFNGYKLNEGALLKWQSINEKDLSHYILEKKEEGGDYLPIAEINGKGNSVEVQYYEFIDVKHDKDAHYRLRVIKLNGEELTHHHVVFIPANESLSGFKIVPNPSSEVVRLEAPWIGREEKIWMRVIDMLGRTVINKEENLEGLNAELEYNLKNLSNGMYTVNLEVRQETHSLKWVVQRLGSQ